jgi:hypothetical protein
VYGIGRVEISDRTGATDNPYLYLAYAKDDRYFLATIPAGGGAAFRCALMEGVMSSILLGRYPL